MPRRLPVRPAKVFGNFFVLIVLCLMGFIYYTYVFVVWGPRAEEDTRAIGLLIFYHVIFFMLLWSFFQTMITDPGQVPVFWGFHLGDNENKRRRYCLMCNVFKPERCHHCSACNRCVLNMDHHCPWINNCVGFWNRKFFLLLLCYVLMITYLTFFTLAYDFYKIILWGFESRFIDKNDEKLRKNSLIILAFILDTIVCVLMTAFLRFHMRLALENKTTIENLDKQGQPYVSQYDIGERDNWRQIFGTNPWIWPIPMTLGSGKPVGDGIYWQTALSIQQMNPQEKNSMGLGLSRNPKDTNLMTMGPTMSTTQMTNVSKVGMDNTRTMSRSKSPPEHGMTPSTTIGTAHLNNQLSSNQNIFHQTNISQRPPQGAFPQSPPGLTKSSQPALSNITNMNGNYTKALQMHAQMGKANHSVNFQGKNLTKTSPQQSFMSQTNFGTLSQKSFGSGGNPMANNTTLNNTSRGRQGLAPSSGSGSGPVGQKKKQKSSKNINPQNQFRGNSSNGSLKKL